jgi:uncharacterized protein YvpB
MQEEISLASLNFEQNEEPIDAFSAPPKVEKTARFTFLPLQRKLLFFTGVGVVLIALLTLAILRTALAITPSYTKTNFVVNQPLVISLNEAVRSVDLNAITITPAVAGKWTFKSGDFFGQDKLIFTPTTYFKVDTTYTVSSTMAKRVVFGSVAIAGVQFKTEPAPSLTSKGLVSAKNGSSIAADFVFTTQLASPNKNLRDLVLKTVPANIAMVETVKDDQYYSWKPKEFLPQGTPISVQVYDAKNNVTLTSKNFAVATAPAITVPVQATEFGQADIATITFNQPIDPSSSKDISFNVAGTGKWQSDATYAYTPLKVSPGQSYSYTLKEGLRTKEGGILVANQTNSFSTVGATTVIASTPHGSSLSQDSEQVGFTFDQPVDHASAVSHFSVSSGTLGAIAWQGNTMTATVTNLGYQTTVTAKVAAGILNAGFGLPSNQIFTNSFTTAIRVNRLNIPYYHQQYAGSCAAASLRMILAYDNIATDDMSIVDQMGYNPTVEDKSTTPATWDDPQQMFVGSVNGDIKDGTGAGPDAQPVAKAAEAYGRNAAAVTGIGVAWIAQQLYNNDPVIFFGAYSNTSFTSWVTPSGRTEVMNLTSHARTITGVEGNPTNPIGFWVSDPISGASFWTAAEVQASINLDAYQQAVVVY